MLIYHYDSATGEYLGSSEATPNPAFGDEGQDEFLIPAFATAIEKPTTADREAAWFVDGAWDVRPDMRGVSDPKPAYDPMTQTIQEAAPAKTGGVWTQQWVVLALDTETIAAKRTTKITTMIEAIKAERDRRKFNGVRVGTQWLHTDTYSRTQWLGMVLMGASVPAVAWTTMDGTTITTSQALAGQVFQGTAMLDATLFDHARVLIAQVEAAADPAAVNTTTGWPATFGEV